MAQVVYTPNAVRNLERLHGFLQQKNPDAAARAITTIRNRVRLLSQFPKLGKVDSDYPIYRELFITFGAAGYVARYYFDDDDLVVVLAIRHMREVGYSTAP